MFIQNATQSKIFNEKFSWNVEMAAIPTSHTSQGGWYKPWARPFEGSTSQLLQTTKPLAIWFHDLCLEVLTVHGIELRLIRTTKHSPNSYYKCSSSRYHVFSYAAVWTENWTQHLQNAGQMRYLLRSNHNHAQFCEKKAVKKYFVFVKKSNSTLFFLCCFHLF